MKNPASGRSSKAGISPPIVFGTSGWRGVFGEDFTLPRVRIAVGAVARWLAETSPGGEVVVAHDTRPGGERFAELASNLLRAHGAECSEHMCPERGRQKGDQTCRRRARW